jgi:hypothetical protein
MPALVRLGAETSPTPEALAGISSSIDEALATAEAAGYRVDLLLGPVADAAAGEPLVASSESDAVEPDTAESEVVADAAVRRELPAEKPAHPAKANKR